MSDQISSGDTAGHDSPLPVTPTAAASRWEDFIDIFYAPSAVFERRKDSGFGIPMLVVTLVGAAIFLATYNAMSPIFDAEFTRNTAAAMKKGATAAQVETGRAIGEKFIKLMVFIAPPVIMFLTGLVLWLCGKLVGAKQTLTAAVMVAAFANVPRILSGIIGGAQALVMDPSTLNSRHHIALSVARFMDPDTTSPVLVVIASRFDVFTIWATILLAIGLAVTGRIPRSKAAIAAALVWVLGVLPELSGALRQ